MLFGFVSLCIIWDKFWLTAQVWQELVILLLSLLSAGIPGVPQTQMKDNNILQTETLETKAVLFYIFVSLFNL
jgi:hypothetical protein